MCQPRPVTHIVGQGPRARVIRVKVVHLHHRLVNVHQLLQFQLLAVVGQFAQGQAVRQIRLQLDQSLEDLFVRFVLLTQAVVFILRITPFPQTNLPTRTEYQIRVCIVDIG